MELSNYVTYKAGDFPLILCSPHGGDIDITSIPQRKNFKPCNKSKQKISKCHITSDESKKISFVTEKDGPLTEVTHLINNNIRDITGHQPFLVICNVIRGDIDMNRSHKYGTEDEEALKIWEYYFQCIETACQQVQKKFGQGLLIDLHAYAKRKSNMNDIVQIGYGIKKSSLQQLYHSQNLTSSKKILHNFSLRNLYPNHEITQIPEIIPEIRDLIFGKNSFGNILQDFGMDTYPSLKYSNIDKLQNFRYYIGGYTTRTLAKIIPSLQIEFSKFHLKDLEKTCHTTAIGILYYLLQLNLI